MLMLNPMTNQWVDVDPRFMSPTPTNGTTPPKAQMPYLNQQEADNYIPKQQIKRVNGKAGIGNLKMAANSSVILPDTDQPKIWMLVSDDFGNISSTPYRITPWVDEPEMPIQPQIQSQQKSDAHNYVALESRVGQLENLILEMEDKLNGQSNATTVNAK